MLSNAFDIIEKLGQEKKFQITISFNLVWNCKFHSFVYQSQDDYTYAFGMSSSSMLEAIERCLINWDLRKTPDPNQLSIFER